MDQPGICPNCGEILLPNTNFCPKCGYKINTAPQAISIGRQVWIYIVSLFLPPLGLIWTFKYFRSTDAQKKRIAWIATVLTIISTVFTIWYTINFFQGVSQQINQVNSAANQFE